MRITPIVASRFRVDGGTIFGVVPKAIWSKRLKPDLRNTVPQHANCLLVELADGRVGLVDTGCGGADMYSAKQRRNYGLGDGWPLVETLERLGLGPQAIDFVIFTHLHWDHVGGAGRRTGGGTSCLTFPLATHIVHTAEWEDATGGDPLFYKAYPQQLLEPLKADAGCLRLIDDDESELFEGLRMVRSGGHTRGHCVVVMEGPDLSLQRPDAQWVGSCRRVVFAADVCPTQHHLRMVFHTAFDTFPLETRAWNRRWLPGIAQDGDLLLFAHDAELFGATLRPDKNEEFAIARTLPIGASFLTAQDSASST